ncbi:MAG: AAA family ATPase [Candidatus Omnitrophica bacterium]|nr:AAA family ATPase [Candidatus Omnitrophota bacterium]
MYEEYWGLREKPFENTADPRFLYESPQHQEALTRLRYAIYEDKGIAVLTGIFGCGKTVIAEKLLKTLIEDAFEVAFVVNPQFSAIELLRDIIYNLGYREKLTDQKDEVLHKLTDVLKNNFDNGKRSVIIIDEAHLIGEMQIFEELRVLLNYQYNHHFLLTLLLLGQPELRERINNLKQFSQRVAIRYRLDALDRQDVKLYIQFRLKVAGSPGEVFEESSYDYIFRHSGGIPRRINQICDMSLLTGYCEGVKTISPNLIEVVAKDLAT